MVVLKKKNYKIDLDYEAFLFDPNYSEAIPKYLKINKEFEYIFFLVNKEEAVLKNVRSYEKSYLDSLKKIGFVIPGLNSNAEDFDYWWGRRKDIELERILNSKITSAEIAINNGWGFFEGAIVEKLSDVKNHLGKYSAIKKWIIKRPHGFSGIGHYQFETENFDESVLLKILTEKVLLEPYYERVFDIGSTFEVRDGVITRSFMVENFNSETGGFKGGAGASDVEKFKKYIEQKYHYSLDELVNITLMIAKKYLSLGATSNIQIDSFVYRENGELKLYGLVEVNYRKSMGLVIQGLAERFTEASWVEWRVVGVKNTLSTKEWIKLSPDGNHFKSFFKKNI